MKSIFELTTPRDEVLQDELSADMFAARLKDVMENRADPVYGDPERFFQNTYPTAGLKTLLREVLGRLTGEKSKNSPILRLETSFGGGKTHNLIALYHAVTGSVPEAQLRQLLGEEIVLPEPGEIDVAGVVGSDLDPSSGIYHEGAGVRTYTLWGELAYQLGGRPGYMLTQESDEKRSAAPGTGLFEQIIGDRPTLIMIDEIARHLRAAAAVPTATGEGTVADQTVAFLMSLLEYAASQERVVVVLTMASDVDAFSRETSLLRESLQESLKVSARQERVLTPTGENEVSAIVVHRLFEQVDKDAAKAVIERYGAYYQEKVEQQAPIHERAVRGEYLQEFKTAYPFHPELIRVLNLKVATIPNFQRTRGALRLLATVVRELWRAQPAHTWLIHPYHVDLRHDEIIEDLTSRLDRPKFKQVCEADIVSPHTGVPAHAAEADAPLVAGGKPRYARRMGTGIFLHSLTQGIATGVELPELLLGILTPLENGGDDPAVVQRALERLYQRAWFLEYDGFRYRFKTEPSLNKIVDDEVGSVGLPRAKREVDERIRSIWRAGYFKTVYFPDTPGDVGDDAQKPKLAIMHYDAVSVEATTTGVPELVRKIYSYTGASEQFRTYQNNLVFLVADGERVEQMVNTARRYLAINRITGSAERMREFTEDHQKQLRKMAEGAELDVRVAITSAYRYLFYPTPEAPRDQERLRRETIPAQGQGEANTDQTNVVLKVLHNLQKVLTADDPVKPAAYLKARAWEHNQNEMTTEDLSRAFARKIALPILLDVSQLRRSIENGVKQGVWVYYDTRDDWAYDAESPPAYWRVDDDARLYDPATAAALNLRIKGKWQPTEPPENGDDGEGDDEPPEGIIDIIVGGGKPTRLTGEGVPAQAFQQLRDAADEHEIAGISRLRLHFGGMDTSRAEDLVALGLAIPQLGRAEYGIRLKLALTFGDDGHSTGELDLTFEGDWDRYKRLKSVTDAFVRAADVQSRNLEFELVVSFEEAVAVSGQQIGTMQEVLTQMGLGPVRLEATVVYESEEV